MDSHPLHRTFSHNYLNLKLSTKWQSPVDELGGDSFPATGDCNMLSGVQNNPEIHFTCNNIWHLLRVLKGWWDPVGLNDGLFTVEVFCVAEGCEANICKLVWVHRLESQSLLFACVLKIACEWWAWEFICSWLEVKNSSPKRCKTTSWCVHMDHCGWMYLNIRLLFKPLIFQWSQDVMNYYKFHICK